MQALDQRHHVGEDDVVHFVEAFVEGGDQRFLARMQRCRRRVAWTGSPP